MQKNTLKQKKQKNPKTFKAQCLKAKITLVSFIRIFQAGFLQKLCTTTFTSPRDMGRLSNAIGFEEKVTASQKSKNWVRDCQVQEA